MVIASPTIVSRITKLRQILACPKLLDPNAGYGAAMEHLLLEMEEDPHVVVFTPFLGAIEFLCEAMKDKGMPDPYILKGGTKSEVVGQVERHFNGEEGKERSLIASIGFAESYELYSAKQVFFLGYDWSQLTNYQAEKRLHRLTTPHPVNAWYYRCEGTIDDDILQVLHTKEQNMRATFSHFIQAINKQNDH